MPTRYPGARASNWAITVITAPIPFRRALATVPTLWIPRHLLPATALRRQHIRLPAGRYDGAAAVGVQASTGKGPSIPLAQPFQTRPLAGLVVDL